MTEVALASGFNSVRRFQRYVSGAVREDSPLKAAASLRMEGTWLPNRVFTGSVWLRCHSIGRPWSSFWKRWRFPAWRDRRRIRRNIAFEWLRWHPHCTIRQVEGKSWLDLGNPIPGSRTLSRVGVRRMFDLQANPAQSGPAVGSLTLRLHRFCAPTPACACLDVGMDSGLPCAILGQQVKA